MPQITGSQLAGIVLDDLVEYDGSTQSTHADAIHPTVFTTPRMSDDELLAELARPSPTLSSSQATVEVISAKPSDHVYVLEIYVENRPRPMQWYFASQEELDNAKAIAVSRYIHVVDSRQDFMTGVSEFQDWIDERDA